MPLLLLVGLFGTPIFYSPAQIPERFGVLSDANPFAWLVEAYRDVLLRGEAPDPAFWFGFVPLALVVASAGRVLFEAGRPTYPEVL